MSDRSWLVIYCAARHENLVAAQLLMAGFEYYCAVYKRRLHRIGSGFVLSPLFPRYIFLRARPDWQAVCSFRGVQDLLKNDEIPLKIMDEVIEEIKKRQAAGEFDEKLAPRKRKPRARSFRELKQLLDARDAA